MILFRVQFFRMNCNVFSASLLYTLLCIFGMSFLGSIPYHLTHVWTEENASDSARSSLLIPSLKCPLHLQRPPEPVMSVCPFSDSGHGPLFPLCDALCLSHSCPYYRISHTGLVLVYKSVSLTIWLVEAKENVSLSSLIRALAQTPVRWWTLISLTSWSREARMILLLGRNSYEEAVPGAAQCMSDPLTLFRNSLLNENHLSALLCARFMLWWGAVRLKESVPSPVCSSVRAGCLAQLLWFFPL